MVREALAWLMAERGGVFLDCTVGLGGHARALLEAGATRVIGVDRDAEALAEASQALAPWPGRVDLVHSDYRDLGVVLDGRGLSVVDGAIADLGMSSFQLETEGRGFTFRRDEPLDMRMDRSQGPTAAELLRNASERELADVIYQYGEERRARRIARALVSARRMAPLVSTGQLGAIVRRVLPRKARMRLDPATRTFQAIRIWVNRELEGGRWLPGNDLSATSSGCAPCRDCVPFARGSHCQAHPACTRARSLGARADAAADDAGCRRSRAEPPSAQRQAACGREIGMTTMDFEYAIKKDVRNNHNRSGDRRRAAARAVAIGRRGDLSRRGPSVFRVAALRAAPARVPVSNGCNRIVPRREEINRHLRLEVEMLQSPKRIERMATEKLGMVAPSRDEAIVIERVTPTPPPAKSIVATR